MTGAGQAVPVLTIAAEAVLQAPTTGHRVGELHPTMVVPAAINPALIHATRRRVIHHR